jgi:hypothetical protein
MPEMTAQELDLVVVGGGPRNAPPAPDGRPQARLIGLPVHTAPARR